MESNATIQSGIFAERRLRLHRAEGLEEILVQFGPIVRQDGSAFCRYTLSSRIDSITREIWGVDDVQALELAMKMAGTDLDLYGKGGKYSIDGDGSDKEDGSDEETGHGLPSQDFAAMEAKYGKPPSAEPPSSE